MTTNALELAERSVVLARNLTSKDAGVEPDGKGFGGKGVVAGQLFGGRMFTSEFKRAAGLAFTFVGKFGVGITLEKGRGFVIAKTAAGWSAPLFVTISGAGVGATVGFTEIESCIVLASPASVERFTKASREFGSEVGAAAGTVAAHTSTPSVTSDFGSDFSYSISSGAIIDFSYQGMKHAVDEETNHSLYGAQATPEAILGGSVPPPPAFEALYTFLASSV